MTQIAAPFSFDQFFSQLFTYSGRTNRAKYWLALLLLVCINLLAAGLSYASPALFYGPLLIVPIGLWLLAAVIGILACIRRLHDRGKSGHWLWFFIFVPTLLNVIGNVLVASGEPTMAIGTIVLGVAAFGISIWALVEMGFLRGAQGPNSYGPDPLQAA